MMTRTAKLLLTLLAMTLSVSPLFAAQEADPCSDKGIIVRNATMLDLWYKKNAGPCSIWRHEHRFPIKPEESITLFSDMECKTLYCPRNPAYKDYKSLDANGNCGVRILPRCTLSDM
jgi:hypothetical protein